MGMWSSKGERTALTARVTVLPQQALSDASNLTVPSPLFFCLLTSFHLMAAEVNLQPDVLAWRA